MTKFWRTDWDPYQSLLTAENNIQQLAIAHNENRNEINQLGAVIQHQQEVIQQIVQQNNKLNQILTAQRAEMNLLKQRIEENNRGTKTSA